MTYVITGARGYIGRALTKLLIDQGRDLRLVSRSRVISSFGRGSAPVKHVHADLRREESWRALLDGASAVIHLSARTDLKAAEVDPDTDRVLNVEPVRALVRAAERCSHAIPVIFASTATIVGDKHVNPVDERVPDRPCSVYDRHKLECEILLKDATCRGVLRACSLRLSNVYGCADIESINTNRGILNALMRRAMHGEALTLYGDGKYVRDFVFIDDVVDALRRAIGSGPICNGEHYVIATGSGHTLAETFELVAEEAYRATGRHIEIRRVAEPSDLHPIERRSFVGDSRAFRILTGWHPKVALPSGIHKFFRSAMVEYKSTVRRKTREL
jgi:nucleoside-diphosphate-sugar epimerase